MMNLQQALRHFAEFEGRTQSQEHIRPLHEYVSCRLVIEGGFHPDDIKPRPPFTVEEGNRLVHDPQSATRAEATVLGGLKTKNIDIVVFREGIGPVLAVSCKGMTGAVRNLTNRLEETIGECTNIHITYPGWSSDIFSFCAPTKRNWALRPRISPLTRMGRLLRQSFVFIPL